MNEREFEQDLKWTIEDEKCLILSEQMNKNKCEYVEIKYEYEREIKGQTGRQITIKTPIDSLLWILSKSMINIRKHLNTHTHTFTDIYLRLQNYVEYSKRVFLDKIEKILGEIIEINEL